MKNWIIIASAGIAVSIAGAGLAQAEHPAGAIRAESLVKRNAVQPNYTPTQRARILETGRLAYAASDAMKSGDYAAAEADARQSIAIGPDSGLAQEVLAASLDAQGKTSEALQAYKKIADAQDNFPANLLPYARLLLKAGDYRLAVLAYNKALPLIDNGYLLEKEGSFPPDVLRQTDLATAIHIALGLELEWRGYHGTYQEVIEQSQTHFQKALAMEPNSSLANYFYGYGLKRLGRGVQAEAAFKRAASLGQGDVKEAAQKELPETMRPK